MKKGMISGCGIFIIMLFTAALFSTPLLAAEFTADVDQRLNGRELTGKIFVKGEKYCVEMQDARGNRMVVIVDQKSDMTIALDPKRKQYMETKTSGMFSLMNDPFQSARHTEAKYKKTLLGREKISGYACEKLRFESNKKELMTVWKSKKLAFFLKITLPDKKHSFIQLKNIKERSIEDDRFKVPAGYTSQEEARKREKQKREREEAALPVVTKQVKGEVPWARRIGPGGEMRVKVDPKKSVRFKFENLIKGESVITVKAFSKGRPIKMDIKETYSLKGKGRSTKPLLGMQNRADEVAIRVQKGKIIATIINEESSFAKDKIQTFFMLTGIRKFTQGKFLVSKRNLRLVITGDSQDGTESRFKVQFYKGDYKDKVDESETVLKNGRSKTWEYPASKGIRTLEITLAEHGGIKVRIEQPAFKKAVKPRAPAKIITTAPKKRIKKVSGKTAPGKSPGPRLSRKQSRIIIKALNANDIAAVESELDKGMDVNSMLYGGTLLMRAANLSTADMVRMLISRGADLNYRTRRGDDALSVGMSNSRHWKEVVPALVKAGITIDEKTPIWKLGFKTKRGKLLPEAKKTLNLLFAKGASPDCYTGSKKTTVIMYYAKKGWLDPIKFFLDHGANVNARTTDGRTPLSIALKKPRRREKESQKRERQEVIKLLKSRGAK
ncbi:MAG: hypothetical protein DRG82_14905 [Deltaproteobacteria bacterium]|nr:MAG: hypothetical protein DRG82_14905 [Deltaproteobacteria bacterium]